MRKKLARSTLALLIILLFLAIDIFLLTGWLPPTAAAQSTGDTLSTRTPTPQPSVTPKLDPTLGPEPAPTIWVGRLVSNTLGVTKGNGSIIRVSVAGLIGTRIELRSGDYLMFAESGSKPEYGPYTAEFAPVTKGTWLVSVPSLGVSLPVEADGYNLAMIEFVQSPALPPATPTPTNTATRLLPPTATATSIPPTYTPFPTATPAPTNTAFPLSSPTPVTRWLGTIEARQNTGTDPPSILVEVFGIEGLPIRLRAVSGVEGERRCITGQGAAGQDTCAFTDLLPGQYIVAPEGLGLSLPLSVAPHEQVKVIFDVEVLPSGLTGWEARLLKNTNGPQAVLKEDATIRVRLTGRAGQVIALRSVRGTERFCEVAPNPVLGALVCEFGQLGPGVYLVEAVNTGAGHRLFIDGEGLAEIAFSPTATQAALALAQLPPIVGQGAQPSRMTATSTPPGQVSLVVKPSPIPVSSPTRPPSPTPWLTPTPAFAWQGRIVETVDLVVGTIGVRAAGLRDHPVILRSGGWQSEVQLTGTKPELGEYAVEFGGLAQGEYIVELVGLAELKVRLGPDQFLLVEFRYDFVTPP